MRKQKLIIFLFLIITSCEKTDNGFTAAGPISSYLIGKWELKKIENTRTSKTITQLGYVEILENGNNNIDDYNRIYRDGLLISTYIRARSRGTDMNVKNMTVLDRFSNNTERFYQIVNANTQNISIEASGYLERVGSPADTLKYYYSIVK